MNDLNRLLKQLKTVPESINFQDVIGVIDRYYHYTPTDFYNGLENDGIFNKAGVNEGSCKIFSFALLQQLDEIQTLHCFGQYYRNDVLKNPEATDHANIRTFIRYGWNNINFETNALEVKEL